MIDEHGNTVTAADADRILGDATFRAILKKVKDDQINTFINSHATQPELREHAHKVLQAINEIEMAFKSVKDDEAIKQKRKGRS